MWKIIRPALACAILIAPGLASADGQADAGTAWALSQVQAIKSLTPSLAAAAARHWLIIPYGDLQGHDLPHNAYVKEIAPRLDRLAATWLPDLTRELDGQLRTISFEAIQARHDTKQSISYCHWIVTDNDGRGPPLLATGLFNACRAEASTVVTELLMRHADDLDVPLSALPRLDVSFPGWFTADLARPDWGGAAAVDQLDAQRGYLTRLGKRLSAAEPGLERQLDAYHAGRGWSGERLAAPAETCATLLGPLQVGSVGPAEFDPIRQALTARCVDGAGTRLMALLPKLQAALPKALVDHLQSDMKLRSAGSLCSEVVGHWLGQGDYATEFRTPLEASCAVDAAMAVADVIAARATRLAAPLLTLPRTLEAMEDHAWFSLTDAQLGSLTLPDDPGRGDLQSRVVTTFLAMVSPSAAAAVENGKARIGAAYERAAGRAEAFRDVLQLCGEGGIGAQLPAPGRGGEAYREQVAAACVTGHQSFSGARVALAQARAGVAAASPLILMLPSGNGEVAVVFQDLVSRAAMAGVQLKINTGTLGGGRSLIATPVGADAPALSGPVTQVRQGWRLSAFEQLPGWPADPADTVACLGLTDDDLADAQAGALFKLLTAVAAADDDRPRTARNGFAHGLERLRQAGAMQGCLGARGKYFGQ